MSLLRYIYARIDQTTWDLPSYDVFAIAPDLTSSDNEIHALLTLQFLPEVGQMDAAEDRISALGSMLTTVSRHGPRPFEAQMVNFDRAAYNEGTITLVLGSERLRDSPWNFESSFLLVEELLAVDMQQDSRSLPAPDPAVVSSLLSQAITMIGRSAPGDKFTSVTVGPKIPDTLVFQMSAMQSLTGVSLSNFQAANVVKAIQSILGRFGARTIAFDVLASAAPVALVARGSLKFGNSVDQTNSTALLASKPTNDTGSVSQLDTAVNVS
ncbi:MAG: hypothetical protein OHK93_002679 [Ramalina farinacea]|uniref:Uncharacterized protein n=1 Tax=Ramalina farinacea TaxID=258253 RepID=A0AA43QRW9_9LECA|nr:hypothetical protein [Ramalina farinacea]